MATRQQVQRLAAKFGGELLIHSERPLDCELMAPHGYHWKGDDVHALVGSQWDDSKVSDVYEDLIARVTGVERCTVENSNCRFWHGDALADLVCDPVPTS